MKAKFVLESLNEQPEDVYHDDEDVEVVDETPFDEVEDDADDDEIIVADEFETSLNNELKVPEYARRTVSFKIKGQPGVVDAVPMARMKDGSFLMKVGDTFKKFKMSDIIEESAKGRKR